MVLSTDWVGGEAVPVRQDMGGDEVDRRGQLRMVDPDRPDFAGRDRYRAHPLHALHDLDQLGDALFDLQLFEVLSRPFRFRPQRRLVAGEVATQRGLVADHDRVDVAVAARERDGGLDFPFVAGLVLVDPDAERHLEPELGGNCRHELDAAGRAIGADGVGIGAENLQVGANLLRRRTVAVIRMLRSPVRRIGNAGKRRIDIGDRLLPLEQSPQAGMHADDERHHSSDGAH